MDEYESRVLYEIRDLLRHLLGVMHDIAREQRNRMDTTWRGYECQLCAKGKEPLK